MNSTTENTAGYRLHRFEVLNWGTFDKKIWKINPNGSNALITGDIGSGKSTLIDALTTLIVPAQKITYNKAAGAESRERNPKSYFLGAFKGEKTDFSGKSKAITLRKVEDGTYSVLLACFYNDYYKSYCTIAQVLRLKSEGGDIEKLFIVAENDLSIAQHFQNFTEIREVKKRLKEIKSVDTFDSFKEYATRFRQIMGIKTDEAIELFYQTVSMKQVTNLTDFVRVHMLSKTDVGKKIEELLERFEHLDTAHKAILKAKRQLELLDPIVEELGRYNEVCFEIERLEEVLTQIPYYFAYHKAQLLQVLLSDAYIEYERAEGILENAKLDLERFGKQAEQIKDLIKNNETGKRLTQIDEEITKLVAEKSKKQDNEKDYKSLAEKIGLPVILDEGEFYENKKKLGKISVEIAQKQTKLRESQDDILLKKKASEGNINRIEAELSSLRTRKTQIKDSQLKVRRRILDHFGLDENELPFVGELIKVKETETIWEGAIEKRLNELGKSIIVADELYNQVSHFINMTTFEGERIVYFRAIDEERRSFHQITNQSLVKKIHIKESEFYDWIEQKLINDHNLICCDTVEEFRRTPYAITKEGSIKLGKSRHEKNDRIHNRRDYILGWSNTAKVNLLENDLKDANQQFNTIQRQSQNFNDEERILKQQSEAILLLNQVTDYAQLNWQEVATQILELQNEASDLKATSSELDTLKVRLEKISKEITKSEGERDKQNKIIGNIESDVLSNQV
jgi:uncharacterized protein YPO0396